jgi:hypothetical protein
MPKMVKQTQSARAEPRVVDKKVGKQGIEVWKWRKSINSIRLVVCSSFDGQHINNVNLACG